MAKATNLIIGQVYSLLDKGISPTRISEMLPVSRRQVYYLRDRRAYEQASTESPIAASLISQALQPTNRVSETRSYDTDKPNRFTSNPAATV